MVIKIVEPFLFAKCLMTFLSRRFTPEMLIDGVPDVGCIVDLTATMRYYDPYVSFSNLSNQSNECSLNRFMKKPLVIDN